MVRFIISKASQKAAEGTKFTFQYGQIYYQGEFDKDKLKVVNLHSNMVRFIILTEAYKMLSLSVFTFQYGQIYYYRRFYKKSYVKRIYIPIWLDLLSFY